MTCIGYSSAAPVLFIGSADGLIQAFSSSTLKPVSRPLAISPYAVRNIESFKYGHQIHLAIALASGQVVLYRSLDQGVRINQDHRKDGYMIMYNQRPQSLREISFGTAEPENPGEQLDFEFVTQVLNHFEHQHPQIWQLVRVAQSFDPVEPQMANSLYQRRVLMEAKSLLSTNKT